MNETMASGDRPIERSAGVSPKRERMWGLLGGAMGAAFGVTSALIAVYVEGASWTSNTSPYPAFFTQPHLLAYDRFLFGALMVGGALAIASVILARMSRFPRTDASGAGLGGAIIVLLSGALLFTRLVAIAGAR